MDANWQRAMLLYQQRRYEQAIGELQLQLGQNSADFLTHGLLALCYNAEEKYDPATDHAQQAIHLGPDQAFGYYALARVMTDRHRLPEALAAVQEAIRLEPQNAHYFAVLASIHLQQHQWKEALEAANQGLQIDPEESDCTNLRAQAQVKLGDRAGASATIDKALQRRPDDAYAHANQGWALLEAGQPKQAMEHFREALRLKPDLDWARAGIVEALKARNIVYRVLLGYFLWMAKLSPQVQWGVVIGLLVAQRLLRAAAEANPSIAPFVQPLLLLYLLFVVMTWIAYPLFNLMLRFDRFGRHVLNKDQTSGANALAVCIVAALAFVIAAFATGIEECWLAAIVCGLLSAPVTSIYRCDPGWPRRTMAIYTAALLVVGLLGSIPAALVPVALQPILDPVVAFGFILFLIGIFVSQFLANYLVSVTPKR
jgi:tetratricopeptide (TPR) repeat protein